MPPPSTGIIYHTNACSAYALFIRQLELYNAQHCLELSVERKEEGGSKTLAGGAWPLFDGKVATTGVKNHRESITRMSLRRQ